MFSFSSVLGRPALRVSQHFRTRLLEAFESKKHLQLREQIGLDPDDLHELREKSYIAEKVQVMLHQRIPMTFAEMFVSLFAVLSAQFRRVPLESVADFQKLLLADLRGSQLGGGRSESAPRNLEITNHDRGKPDEEESVTPEPSQENSEDSDTSKSTFSSLFSRLFNRSSSDESTPDSSSSSSPPTGDTSSRKHTEPGRQEADADVCLNTISADEVIRAVNALDPRREVPGKVQVLISRYLESLIDAHPEVCGKGLAVVDFFDDDELDLESLRNG